MNLNFIIDKPYRCPVCEICFDRKFDRDRHCSTKHGKAQMCTLCLKILKSGKRKDMQVRHLMKGCQPFRVLNAELNEQELNMQAKNTSHLYFKDST